MATQRQDLVKLGIDLYHGESALGKYNVKDANEVLRKELLNVNGGNINYKDFRRNKVEFFEIIEETLSQLVIEGLENQFDDFAEIRNLAWGDTNKFIIPNTQLFKIATISDGNGNIRRQKLTDRGEFTIPLVTKGVKIYEELYKFLAGRVNWKDMVDRVAKSWNLMVKEEVYNAIYNSFNDLNATYGVSGAFDLDVFTELCQHVEASTGADVIVYGTKKALSKVTPAVVSDNMRDKRNITGYYGVVNGYELREIKQAHKVGTDTFAIDDNFLLIVPTLDDKMVKIVIEGDAIIQETPGGINADMTMEYLFTMKIGFGVVPASKYGIYRLA